MGGRGKKAVLNSVTALCQEFVAVICGFILPRLILRSYGSTYNGLTTSITQFLSCAVLLRAGIGGATRAALYKPLASNDQDRINAIMSATNVFMKKIARILLILIAVFSCVYPLFFIKEFDWFFSFSLFLIIGLSTFAESLFGITYIMLLQADQRLYMASVVRSLVYILSTGISALLIISGAGIHLVKLGGALAFCIYPVFLNIYVRRKYKLDLCVAPDNNSISQRWDAFWHQVANFVMNNTDTAILTIFTNSISVSVYSVYNLVINGLKKLIMTFTNGLEGAFGNMIASESQEVVETNFYLINYLMFSIATIVDTCSILLILPFVSIYTRGVTDAEYIQPIFAIIIIAAHYFNCIRQPYQLIVQAAGHYTQTKRGSIIEPIINISLSVVFVIKYGLVGVAVGTLVATLFRTVQYAVYVSNHLVKGAVRDLLFRLLLSICEILIIIFAAKAIPFGDVSSYWTWIVSGVVYLGVSVLVVAVFSSVFYRTELKLFIRKLKGVFRKR